MEGIAIRWKQDEDFANGTIEVGGVWYKVTGDAVEADCIGRVYLEAREPVIFDVGPSIVTRGGKRIPRAVNVRRPWRETSIDPRTHREFCRVINENWLIRVLGGRLTVSPTDPVFSSLYPGQIVECGVRKVQGFRTWQAVDIKIVAETEEGFDWSQTLTVDPQPAAVAQPAAVPQPVEPAQETSLLLTPDYRGVKLSTLARLKSARRSFADAC